MPGALTVTIPRTLALDHSADCLKALGHADRLRIIAALSSSVMTVSELCERLDLPQTRASQHLALLRQVGLVTCEKVGSWRDYRLSETAVTIRVEEMGAPDSPWAERGWS